MPGKARLSGDELVDCFTWPNASAQVMAGSPNPNPDPNPNPNPDPKHNPNSSPNQAAADAQFPPGARVHEYLRAVLRDEATLDEAGRFASCSGRLTLTLVLIVILTRVPTPILTLALTLPRFRFLQWATALRALPPGGLQGEEQRISPPRHVEHPSSANSAASHSSAASCPHSRKPPRYETAAARIATGRLGPSPRWRSLHTRMGMSLPW